MEKNLNISVSGEISKVDPHIFVNDEEIKFSKNKFSGTNFVYTTEKDSVNIKVVRYLEWNSGFWFLIHLFYFIVSIFGIFDFSRDKCCAVIDCEFNINLKSENNNLNLKFNPPPKRVKKGETIKIVPVNITSDCETEILENRYLIDQKAKRRKKGFIAVRVFGWLALITGLILIILYKFVI